MNKQLYHFLAADKSVDDIIGQMSIDSLDFSDIGAITGQDGSSMLEIAIAHRNFSVAEYLLNHRVPVNIVTKEGYNEFHIIAPHLRDAKAVELAKRLLMKNVSLSQTDKKYKNTAMFSITLEIVQHQTDFNIEFLKLCIMRKEGLFEKNIRGFCASDFLLKYGFAIPVF